MVKDKFTLCTPEDTAKVIDWIKSGRGVLRWTNKDLSNMSRGDMFTPGDADKAPHWAYVGQPEPVELDEIEVRTRTKVDLPPEWGPECPQCKGTGHRTVQEIAAIRKTDDIDGVRESLRESTWLTGDTDTFECRSCGGTGHIVERPEFRVKRLPPYRGGGMEVSAAGINKCIKLCRKLEAHYGIDNVQWDWEHWDNGLGRGYFFTETVDPLVIPVD